VLTALAGCNSERATAEGGAATAPPLAAGNTSRGSSPGGSTERNSAIADPAVPQPGSPVAAAGGAAGRGSAPAARITDTSFDKFKFEMELGGEFRREMLGPEIESLAGRRIRIRGYMLPTNQKRGIRQFVLVRDNQECCFGPGAALYDCMLVHMQPGRTAEFSIRPVAVEGTFSIEVFYDFDNVPRAVYRIDGEAVR
jgi:hypothetical protein